ncbi:MAG: glycosyltransferase, partial [Gaiellaceae bacterium]
MAEAPDVSVVIPTRNRWSLLSATALPAALGQEGVELEVVVVDDGSTDETTRRLHELQDADSRVRIVRR